MYGYANCAVLMRFVSLGLSSLLLWGILILPHLYYVNGLCQKKLHTHTHTLTQKGHVKGRGNQATVQGGVQKMEDTLPQQNQNARNCTEI